MARRSAAAALIAALALCAGRASADGLYLFVVPTSNAAGVGAGHGAPLRVAAFVEDPARLAKTLGAAAPAAGADRLEITLDLYPQLAEAAEHDDRAASWVIDYDDEAVVRAREELVAKFGAQPTPRQLVEFVAEFIDDANTVHGFDFASRVARDRSGDCTEHAVLLTALARSFGLRARVALGLAIVFEQDRAQAYGHAWTELRDADRWVVADAALNEAGLAVRYLPYGVLTDESPSYALGLAYLMPVWVKRIEILGAAPKP